MQAEPVTQLIGLTIMVSAEEARELYAELYRISADHIERPYALAGYSRVAELMIQLGDAGVDS